MALQLTDGKGRGNVAAVNGNNQLMTRAITQSLLERSAEAGDAAVWVSTFATGGTDIEVISIENDEATKLLHIDHIEVGAAAACVFTLFQVTSGTPAGTTLTPRNLNLASGIDRSDTSFGNASVTGSLSGNNLHISALAANSPRTWDFQGGLVLGKDDIIAITASANTTVYVTVVGFWQDPDL